MIAVAFSFVLNTLSHILNAFWRASKCVDSWASIRGYTSFCSDIEPIRSSEQVCFSVWYEFNFITTCTGPFLISNFHICTRGYFSQITTLRIFLQQLSFPRRLKLGWDPISKAFEIKLILRKFYPKGVLRRYGGNPVRKSYSIILS